MAKDKKTKKITKKHVKILVGILLILISIYGLINYTIPSTAMVYAMVYLFGNAYFIPFVVLIYLGFTLIYKPLLKKAKKAFVIIGSVFLFLTLLMSLTSGISFNIDGITEPLKVNNIDFSNFYTNFDPKAGYFVYNFTEPTPVFNVNLGGGLLGYILVASFNTLTTSYIGTIIVSIALLLISLFFILFFPIKALVKFIREDSESKVKKFKSAKSVKVEELEKEEENNAEIDEIEEDEEILPLNNNSNKPTSETLEIKNERKTPIPGDEAGFIKPSFDIFNNFISQDTKKVEHNIVSTPKVDQPVFKQPTYYEQPKQTVVERENPISVQQEEFREEPIINNKSTNDFEYTESFDDVAPIFNPEPPIRKPLVNEEPKTENLYSKREIISDYQDDQVSFDGTLVINESAKNRSFMLPGSDLLKDVKVNLEDEEENIRINDEKLNTINEIFEQLNIGAKATGYTIGPAVTRFDIFPNKDVSVSVVEKYVNDLSSRLGGISARFEKIVQGKTSSALEVPNEKLTMVGFKEGFLSFPPSKKGVGDLYIPFGKNIEGKNLGADLAKFPHLLVSGQSGSGKSVYINTVITSLIMRNTPDELKLLIVDPKDVEFTIFNGIPHLLGPVVSDPQKAKTLLERLCDEMDKRYAFLKSYSLKNIKDYNEEAEATGLPKIPYIVCVIDEYADLVDEEKGITAPVSRLAQKARAAGIHLIIALQRPSTDVITGIIKSNMGAKVAFMASKSVDSRVMFDQNGAETLAGNGDMLIQYQTLFRNSLVRAQGYYLSDFEIKSIVNFYKQNYKPEYDKTFTNLNIIDEFSNNIPSSGNDASSYLDQNKGDELYPKIREYIYGQKYCSISIIQRTFGVGFTRAGKLFNMLIKDGIVSADEGIPSRGKEVLIHSEAEFNDLVLERESQE